MARKERNDVDYFPHPVTHGKKMFYLRDRYGNDGYAVWFMLLEKLGKASYHYLDLSDEIELLYLSSELKVSADLLKEVIEVLVKFGEFDKDLWEGNSILFNEKFIENISDAYKKRNNNCIDKNSLLILLASKGIPIRAKSIPNSTNPHLEVAGSTQSKVKYSKVKKSKVKNTISGETSKVPFEERVKKFLEWFNKKKESHTKKKSNIKVLSTTDEKNLKKLLNSYTIEDFNKAIPNLFKNQWAVENGHLTPSHFLRVENFNKYLGLETPKDPEKILHTKVSFKSTGLES